jgi:hypothetical protein
MKTIDPSTDGCQQGACPAGGRWRGWWAVVPAVFFALLSRFA